MISENNLENQLIMRNFKGISKIALLCLLVFLVFCGAAVWFYRLRGSAVRKVILVSLDTCRADRLSCYGFERKTTPNIDRLAAEGILFENAYTPMPLTLPAHSSMFTGTYPPYHKVHGNINYRLDESNVTVAEILRDADYTTAAIISAYVLYPQFGIDQGFESYNYTFVEPIAAGLNVSNRDTERRGGEASEFACRFLEEHKDKSFFLFLHYYDPHYDYIPPEPFATQYSDDLYSGEIAYTDYCLGQVIDKLKELGLYDSTLIIIVGDHGEALGEHGEIEHGYYIYQGAMRVPFIIRAPGLRKAARIDEIVSLVDVMPTILSYLNIEVPDYIQGIDLSVYEKTKTAGGSERAVYAESLTATKYDANPLLGLIDKRFKYIKTTRPELYDLVQDGCEMNNLVQKEPERARLMDGRLCELAAKIVSKRGFTGRVELDEASRKRLESLGYVGGSSISENMDFDPEKKDPKDLIEYYEEAHKVTNLKYRGRLTEAAGVCLEMLQKWPQIPNTYFMLTEVSTDLDKMEDAVEYGLKYLDMVSGKVDLGLEASGLSPTKPIAKTHELVGVAAYKLGKYDLALEQLNKALEIKPDWPEVHNNIAAVYQQAGEIDKAISHLTEALRLAPGQQDIRQSLNGLLAQKRRDEQIAVLKQALAEKPTDVNSHNELAKMYYRCADFAGAAEYWNKSLELNPQQPKICNNLSWLLAAGRDEEIREPQRAVELAERACRLTDFNQAPMLDTLSVAYAAMGRFTEAISTAKEGLELAEQNGQEQLAEEIASHLELYEAGKAFSE